MAMPSGSTVGRSLAEWTARSIAPSSERDVEFLGEEALAAGLRQRPILDGVAGRLDDARAAGARRGQPERGSDEPSRVSLRLRERERLPRVPITQGWIGSVAFLYLLRAIGVCLRGGGGL